MDSQVNRETIVEKQQKRGRFVVYYLITTIHNCPTLLAFQTQNIVKTVDYYS